MSQTKRIIPIVILSLLVATLCSASIPLHIVTVRGVDMVAGTVRVMFTEPLLSEAMIPPGFRLHHRFVDPLVPQQPNTLAKAPSQQLSDARRRLLQCAVLEFDAPIDPEQAARMLSKYDNVVFAEPWYAERVQDVPNDPYYAEQDALTVLGMAQAWDITKGDPSMVVAIVDNGVDQLHEDLKESIFINTAEFPNNGVDDDGNGYVDDYNGYNFTWQMDGTEPGNTGNNGANGHGTNVAGIVSATTNNGKGVSGIAYRCKMFPIKTAPKGSGSILYGYEGMIYAAQRGFKVINCSWGSQSRAGFVKPYSLIDKSVVDYCIANGCLVVSSAGNHGNGVGGSGWLEFNYPSAYDGVMGVAECSTSDVIASTSGLGRNSAVAAPSTSATTTVSGGGYSSAGISGTSFASPMGAGAAALVRVRWPQLTPRQTVALLRATADEILSSNPGIGKAVPRRLNVLAAVSTDPTSIASFRVVGQRQLVHGVQADRFGNGDTLELYYTLKNELGDANPGTASIRVLDPAGWIVQIQNAVLTLPAVQAGESVEVGPYRVVVVQYQDKPCMMDLTISDGVQTQREFVYLEPSATMTTLMNNELSYSIGDRGMFSFGSTLANNMVGNGTGAGWRSRFEDVGWTSGLLFCTGDGKALKAYDNSQDRSDFSAEKPFVSPDDHIGILTDAQSGDREIGIRVTETCTFPSANSFTTVIAIDIENRTAAPLQDVAAGYMFDWDVGPNGADNRTRLAPEALPTSFRSMGEAELFYRDGYPLAIVCAAVSNNASITGQAAGMMLVDYVEDSDRLSDADVVTLLTSGTTIQTQATGDACGVLGMRFPGTLLPGEHRDFMIVIGVGQTAEEAAQRVRETIENPSSVKDAAAPSVHVWPSPATDAVFVSFDQPMTSIAIVDLCGATVLQQINSTDSDHVTINLQSVVNGRYQLLVRSTSGTVYSQPLVVLR